MNQQQTLSTGLVAFFAAFPLELVNQWLTFASLIVSVTAGLVYIYKATRKKKTNN